MNKTLSAVIIVVVLAAGAGGAYLFLKKSNSSTDKAVSNSAATQQMAEHSQDTATPAEEKSTAAQSNAIAIENFAFNANNVTVKKGTTITWTNKDTAGHSVISENDGGPKSQVLKKGETYSFTFDKSGTFHYICGVHPSMKGTVTVTD